MRAYNTRMTPVMNLFRWVAKSDNLQMWSCQIPPLVSIFDTTKHWRSESGGIWGAINTMKYKNLTTGIKARKDCVIALALRLLDFVGRGGGARGSLRSVDCQVFHGLGLFPHWTKTSIFISVLLCKLLGMIGRFDRTLFIKSVSNIRWFNVLAFVDSPWRHRSLGGFSMISAV